MNIPSIFLLLSLFVSAMMASGCGRQSSILTEPPADIAADSIPSDAGDDSITDTVAPQLPIRVELPARIHAVVGDELQLFFRGIIGAVNPYNYDILVSCPVGKKLPRYFSFTPAATDIGSYPFSITVRDDNGTTVGFGESSIEVVTEPEEGALNILTFGDSLTANGIWCHHAASRLPTGILFCGPQENDGIHYFGQGGWKWESYTTAGVPALRFTVETREPLSVGAVYADSEGNRYTILEVNVTAGKGTVLVKRNDHTDSPDESGGVLTKVSGTGANSMVYTDWMADAGNPLWNGERMTFRPYAEKYAQGKADVVYLFLGWNDLSPWQTDFSEIETHIRLFCSTLHEEYPEASVRLMGLQIPSVNGGIGNNYGATGSGYADGYGLCRSVLNLNRFYQELADSLGDYAGFINISCQFDSEYNMPSQQQPVNSHNPATETVGTNGLHPNLYGYRQIGDAVYRDLSALCAKARSHEE